MSSGTLDGWPHAFRLRVYWEDTDAAGIVYYANYLKFIERARTEALLARGFTQTALRAEHGLVFAVRELTVTYLRPARLEDQLVVITRVTGLAGARLGMAQEVRRDEARLAAASVVLVVLDAGGRPRRLPSAVRQALAPMLAGGESP